MGSTRLWHIQRLFGISWDIPSLSGLGSLNDPNFPRPGQDPVPTDIGNIGRATTATSELREWEWDWNSLLQDPSRHIYPSGTPSCAWDVSQRIHSRWEFQLES